MYKSNKLGLSLYEPNDRFRITDAEDSLNHNMELLESAIEAKADKEYVDDSISQIQQDIKAKADKEYVDDNISQIQQEIENNTVILKGDGEDSIVISEGIASGDFSIAGGTTDKEFIEGVVGGSLASIVNLNKSEAQGALSIALGADNIAQSGGSVAMGYNNISGAKGYYFDDIDFTNRTITLSTTRRTSTLIKPSYPSSVSWSAGDKLFIVNDNRYFLEVESVNGNVVTVKELPFSKINYSSTLSVYTYSKPNDRTVVNLTQPKAGTVIVGWGAIGIGTNNITVGSNSYSIGYKNTVAGDFATALGQENTVGYSAFATGIGNNATGRAAHAEGDTTNAIGNTSHSEGTRTSASSFAAHAEGDSCEASGLAAHAEGFYTIASGEYAHAEGKSTEATGKRAHAEGNKTRAIGEDSHAECYNTESSGSNSHAEGHSCKSTGNSAHAEGKSTEASGLTAHAEGEKTIALGDHSHAEGYNTQATGGSSHAEGEETYAIGFASHSSGYKTGAAGPYSFVTGVCNEWIDGDLFQIGNGSESSKDVWRPSNAFRVTESGKVYGGTECNDEDDDLVLVNKGYLKHNLNNMIDDKFKCYSAEEFANVDIDSLPVGTFVFVYE